MIDRDRKTESPSSAERRLAALEEQNRCYALISDLVLEAGRGLGMQADFEGLCHEMRRYIELVLPCHLFAVMQVQKSAVFEMLHCEPQDQFHALNADIDQLIETGLFAKAVRQSGSFRCEADGHEYILTALHTQGRVQGMLVLQAQDRVGKKVSKALHHLVDIFAIHCQNHQLQQELLCQRALTTDSSVISEIEGAYRVAVDPLTGLLTREGLVHELRQCASRGTGSGHCTAMLYLDLDGFHRFNEKHGYRKGNVILKGAAGRVLSSIHTQITYDLLGIDEACISVARVVSDQFAILIHRLVNSHNLELVLRKLRKNLSQGFMLEDEVVYLTACIGVSIYPDDSDSVEVLLANAEGAVKEAKRQGRNKQVYCPAETDESRSAIFDIEHALHAALHLNHFEIYYQPKLDIVLNEISGAEALLRLPDGNGGFISPADFIPIAERVDLIDAIGEWVIRTVSRQVAVWQRDHLLDIPISVNLSAQQLNCEGLSDLYSRIVEEEGITTSAIDLEITETAFVWDAGQAIDNIRSLYDMGFGISLDDFGVGYSSLGRLKRFALNEIKIDRSFIQHIDKSNTDVSIVEAIIMLAERLNLKVVAEGVETHEQLALLQMMGCGAVQGYYIARPMPADRFIEMLAECSKEQ
ncbi:MAG: bifunctional diguanylate cyclase/phosphodiesterase [Sedimenticola sp.]